MSEQTFRSPGFFEQEIELTAPGAQPIGVPGGLVGAAAGGPAFVPTTVASFSDFEARFGGLDPNYPSTYAANEWMKHKGALTFIRVLGAGANASSADFAATLSQGVVRNAGFKLTGQAVSLPDDATSDFAAGSVTIVSFATISGASNRKVTLISTDGTSKTYVFKNGTTGNLDGTDVIVDHTAGGITNEDTLAAEFKTAIESANGHGAGRLTVVRTSATLNITQVVGGTAGNTTITLSNVGSGEITKVDFTGGDESAFDGRKTNVVQFLVARHKLPADTTTPSEWRGFPVFSDNPSFSPPSADTLNIVRGVLMFPTGARGMVLDMTGSGAAWSGTGALIDDLASTDLNSSSTNYGKFKLAISSSLGSTFGSTDSIPGVRILTASFDPSANDYFGKVLNTDPTKLQAEQHVLYLDFPVESELAPLDVVGDSCVAITSGTNSYYSNFGRFDTRYKAARTPSIISQPFGSTEYDLFHFETITDGAAGNDLFKISISNVRASTDPTNPFGTFDVVIRDLYDTDTSPRELERFSGCSLNPASSNYISKKIGDYKVSFNFDSVDTDEQRLSVSGKFPNASRRVRVVVDERVAKQNVPTSILPFGFRGIPVVRTSQTLTDTESTLTLGNNSYGTAGALPRLSCYGTTNLTGSIVPPLPFRFKVTKGVVDGTSFTGQPGILEIPDSRYHWGVKFERLPSTGSTENAVMAANDGTEFNTLINAYSKMQGIEKLDALITGSHADAFNANKFTLARVALSNLTLSDVTGTIEAHMKEAAYIRNGVPNSTDYKVSDTIGNRLTFASLLSGSAATFNKFSEYAKFSTVFYGGFDGVNIFDSAASLLGDKATSTESDGRAGTGSTPTNITGLGYNPGGSELSNNAINSYRVAAKLMTDPVTTNVNVIAVPGIKDPLVTNYVSSRLANYALAMYVLDAPSYDDANARIFDGSGLKPNVAKTADALTARSLNNNYVATYFPDVFVNDTSVGRRVKVPASVAALGALAYGDLVAYPWYAPAGFNRGALDFVSNVEVRLSAADRDYLYDSKINPIASFPGNGYVIFGQKTLQISRSAFDRVNVRRLFLELKRVIRDVARGLLFEPNDATTRSNFISRATPLLALIKSQAGIEQYRIIMDETNNTPADVAASKLNGRIIVVPTRAVEFIAVDFIITPAGVEFI